MKRIKIALLIIAFSLPGFAEGNVVPDWFLLAFNALKLDKQFEIVQTCKPAFLEADFNGDNQRDITVQIINLKTKKKGLLIFNKGQRNYFIFGAGKKNTTEALSDINWVQGWKIFRNRHAYKPIFNADGDILGSKTINIKYPAISIYSIEDGGEAAGQLIYWSGNKYISIHQGD